MNFWKNLEEQIADLYEQMTSLPAWAWLPLYLLALGLLISLAAGVHS